MSSKLFTKLFKSILRSTLWVQNPLHVKVTWITMLAAADGDGYVWSSIPGLAKEAGVTIEEAEDSLRIFLAPDKYSRTPDHEGRRIEVVKGGWRLLNYETKRKEFSEELNRENKREYMRQFRAHKVGEKSPHVEECSDVASLSLSPSESRSDPDPEGVQGEPALPEVPGLLKPGRRERAPLPGAQPALRYEFAPDWCPKESHRLRAIELGLTDAEVHAKAEDCKLKAYPHGFRTEDKQFMRELVWLRNDKETKNASARRPAGDDFERPGHRRTAFGS